MSSMSILMQKLKLIFNLISFPRFLSVQAVRLGVKFHLCRTHNGMRPKLPKLQHMRLQISQ